MVQSAIDIKTWQQRPPSVDEARPATCPCCGVASCPVGGSLRLHGHGGRERQVLGPLGPNEPAVSVVIRVLRYRCTACGAVLVVTPCEVRARRLYSASAIGLALALFGLVQHTAREVRRRVSPAKILGAAAASGWATLQRWARAVRQGRLFAAVPGAPPSGSPRELCAHAAAALAAGASPATRDLPLWQRAFFGAAQPG